MFVKLSTNYALPVPMLRQVFLKRFLGLIFQTYFQKLLQRLLDSIWTRFWLHFGPQNRRKRDGKTEDDIKLKTETPLQRNTRFCFPTRLPNRFKIASKSSWKRSSFKEPLGTSKNSENVANMRPTWPQKSIQSRSKIDPKAVFKGLKSELYKISP